MYEYKIVMQDSHSGEGSAVFNALTQIAKSARYTSLRVSVAYATLAGVKAIVDMLKNQMPLWDSAMKQWAISIDFGRTPPDALAYLASLPKSNLWIPNGEYLLNNKLQPAQCFHPKTFIFETAPNRKAGSLALWTGSANLSLSGLHTGTEHGSLAIWIPPFSNRVKNSFISTKETIHQWWNQIGGNSSPFSKQFLDKYSNIWKKYSSNLHEDTSTRVRDFATSKPKEIETNQGLQWRNAKYFWVQTYELYHNRGALQPGNQLDLRRGTRVFFGFSPEKKPRNTVLGYVIIRYGNHQPCRRSVRFANNSMDKVNLPVPEAGGPYTYDNSFILFERIKEGEFQIKLGNPKRIVQWKLKSRAKNLIYHFSGGREYGFF